jgi:5-methylcytosine-specific restriction protein A
VPIKKLCARCTEVIDIGQTYCDKHQRAIKNDQKKRHEEYDINRRDEKSAEFYHNKEWKIVREVAYTRDNGLCQDCLVRKKIKVGDVVDHIIPIKVNWLLRLVMSNLRTLCHACHNRKSSKDKKEYGV